MQKVLSLSSKVLASINKVTAMKTLCSMHASPLLTRSAEASSAGKGLWLLSLWIVFSSLSLQAQAVFPGLLDHPKLSLRQQGDVLAGELGCIQCHAIEDSSRFRARPAPDLRQAGRRIQPDYLKRFLMAPHATQAQSRMPAMLTGLDPAMREATAEALTHFLLDLTSSEVSADGESEVKNPSSLVLKGKEAYQHLGCVACHGTHPMEESHQSSQAHDLHHLPSKYDLRSLSAFIRDPLSSRPGGRMPDLHLTREEANAIAAWLLEGEPAASDTHQTASNLETNPTLVARGRAAFAAMTCQACHTLDGMASPTRAAPFHALNPSQGCLGDAPHRGPRYTLSADHRIALKASIQAGKTTPDPNALSVAIHADLTRFQCLACHARDGLGGVPAALEDRFTTTEPDLGPQARIPPPLDGVGAKLRLEWLQRSIHDGEGVRPYMLTRMPAYGQKGPTQLPQSLHEHDRAHSALTAQPFVEPAKNEERKTLREGGRQLVGSEGLQCITCHRFNGQPSPQFQGMDLIAMPERLQPDWFQAFLLDPTAFRPGIVMPAYWPGGEATATHILEGQTQTQLQALWTYLTLGRSARDPVGIRSQGSRLTVAGRPLTYRGRSQVAGYRGIAVGFPQGIHYAFNAQTGALGALWRGEFISVGWQGQGSGQFNPIGRPINLPQDVAFHRLKEPDEPWPLRPRTTKEAPVNPDPLYPKRLGYRFAGYDLDADDVPTFHYQYGAVRIEDRITPEATREGALSALSKPSNPSNRSSEDAPPTGSGWRLKRTLVLTTEKQETLWLRLATGTQLSVSSAGAQVGPLQIGYNQGNAQARALAHEANDSGAEPMQELLLQLDCPVGQTTLHLSYDWNP